MGQELGGVVHTVLEKGRESLSDWFIVRAVEKTMLGVVVGCFAMGASGGVGDQELCRSKSVGNLRAGGKAVGAKPFPWWGRREGG